MKITQPSSRLVLAGSALFVASLFAARHLATWPVRLRYPGEASYIEGIPLAEMLQLRQGVPIYEPPSTKRFNAVIYGPLYYLLGARMINPNKPAYLPLREVSLAALVGCAACCSILALWLAGTYFAAALAPILFLAYDFVNCYGTSSRCDVVALFFFFAGFLVAYRFQNGRAMLLAVPFMLLGFFLKQQFVAGPLAVLLFLVLQRRYRLFFEFAGLLAVCGLGLLGFFQFILFRGQAFLRHFLLFGMLPPSLGYFADGVLFFGVVLLWPTLLALELLREHANLLLRCYLGCAVVFSLLTVMRAGSDYNYFLECALILSVLLAALVAKKITGPRATGWILALGIALCLGQWRTCSVPGPADFIRDEAEQDFLRRNLAVHTPALGYYAGDLVRAGLETPISDLYQYTGLIREGALPSRDLLAQLRGRRFGVIALSFDLEHETDPERTDFYLTEPVRQAILANYRLAASLEMPSSEKLNEGDRFYVWVPRP